jgi:hypothetical protein
MSAVPSVSYHLDPIWSQSWYLVPILVLETGSGQYRTVPLGRDSPCYWHQQELHAVALEERGTTSAWPDPAAWQASREPTLNVTLHLAALLGVQVVVEVDESVVLQRVRAFYKEENPFVVFVVILVLHQDVQPNTPRACSWIGCTRPIDLELVAMMFLVFD